MHFFQNCAPFGFCSIFLCCSFIFLCLILVLPYTTSFKLILLCPYFVVQKMKNSKGKVLLQDTWMWWAMERYFRGNYYLFSRLYVRHFIRGLSFNVSHPARRALLLIKWNLPVSFLYVENSSDYYARMISCCVMIIWQHGGGMEGKEGHRFHRDTFLVINIYDL